MTMSRILKEKFRAHWPHLNLRFMADGRVMGQQKKGGPYAMLLTDRLRRETCAMWAGIAEIKGEWGHPALKAIGPLHETGAKRRRQIQDFYGVHTHPRNS